MVKKAAAKEPVTASRQEPSSFLDIATIKRRQKAALIGLGIQLGFGLIFAIIILVAFHHFMGKAMAPLKVMQQQQSPPR